MNPEGLERLLQQVRQGDATVEQALLPAVTAFGSGLPHSIIIGRYDKGPPRSSL